MNSGQFLSLERATSRRRLNGHPVPTRERVFAVRRPKEARKDKPVAFWHGLRRGCFRHGFTRSLHCPRASPSAAPGARRTGRAPERSPTRLRSQKAPVRRRAICPNHPARGFAAGLESANDSRRRAEPAASAWPPGAAGSIFKRRAGCHTPCGRRRRGPERRPPTGASAIYGAGRPTSGCWSACHIRWSRSRSPWGSAETRTRS